MRVGSVEEVKLPRNMRQVTSYAIALARLPAWVSALPKNTGVGRHGFTVVDSMLSAEECSRIRADFDYAIHTELPGPQTGSYIVSRRNEQSANIYDKFVFQWMNYQHCAPWIVERLESEVISRFKHETDVDLDIASYSVQVDWPDTKTKRPFHNDGFSPNFKLFIYLSDVPSDENGPYCIVPGSHRHYFTKWRNLLAFSRGENQNPDDMAKGYRDSDSHRILGPAGTGILSCQALAHKGWRGHTSGKRYVLVVYLAPRQVQRPWTLGREYALASPISDADARSNEFAAISD
jgi:hypothetical protein